MIDFNKVYSSNAYGDFKVIKDLGIVNGKHRMRIKFLQTGYEKDVVDYAIERGKVKDPYLPTIYGVGYIGEYTNIRSNLTLYKTWHSMMSRCYNQNDKDYNAYGNIGVRVCDRWHCFENYFDDVQKLPNYELKVKYPSKYQLDKDYLQLHIPKEQRIYSPDTCIWMSVYDNVTIRVIDDHKSQYYGVEQCGKNNDKYRVTYRDKRIGTFSDPIAAANAYNYFYNKYNLNTHPAATLLNDVPYMPPEEFFKYNTNPKKMCSIIKK